MLLYLAAGAAALLFCAAVLGGLALTVSVSRVRSRGRRELRCGNCGSADLRPSWPTGARDRVYHACGCEPYRCRACYHRFYLPMAPPRDEAGETTETSAT